jgi:Tfp pilus tip-associated adhesin PilY1
MTITATYTTLAKPKQLCRVFCGALLLCFLALNVHGAPASLATEPFALSTKINALPNVMFVLDDSGSMKADFLPDWAGPYQATISGVLSTITPAHRFFNGAYNGVAYNPATRYRPPVMYTNTGALDTTTYPSMNGQSTTSGGDATATVGVPNWRAVKVDGFGVQSVATANLEGNSFSYTTIAGEYCDSVQLRNCIASATPSGANTFPAKLRWCTTLVKSTDTTNDAGTACQASNIADTPTNTTNGVTHYTFARMPRPRTSTITLSGGGTVTNITVDGFRIIPADATGGSDVSLAADIAAKINACTYGVTGATPCTVVGYSAFSMNGAVTIMAPGVTTSAPQITGIINTPPAFSAGNVPGSSLLTVITPTVTSYAYPGLAVKDTNRTDCAGTTCTYAEEMTNYANWYAYYRTRMQMMKTASSIAFSAVDDKFRVGYYTINNGAGNQFLNASAFDGGQKYLWYSKFLSAVPFGATPLRTGLATIGRMYAGQLNASTLNNVGVTDPMQYSCQQNFTILSTDGYWNDASTPKRIDGFSEIGQQDGSLDRPFYDGGTQTKTISQTLQSFQQKMMNTFFVDSKTSQLQTNTSRLSQAITTTTTQPWKLENSQLQTQVNALTQSVYALERRVYPLTETTKVLRENIFNPQSTTRPLEKSTFMLTETSTPLKKTITRIISRTYPLQQGTQQTIATTTPLQRGTQATYATTTPLQRGTQATYATTTPLQRGTQATYATTTPLQRGTQATYATTTPLQQGTQATYATTTPLQRGTQATYATTTPMQKGTQAIYATISPLVSTTYNVQSINFQLQRRSDVSVDGGDTYQDTGWVNVTSGSCSPFVGVRRTDMVINVVCQYAVSSVTTGMTAGCTSVAQSPTSPYTQLTANSCSYETTPVVASVGTCTVKNSTASYMPAVSCAYGTAAAAAPAATCLANDQTSSLATNNATITGNKVVCSVAATPTWANSATCTPANPAYASGTGQISCRYDPVAGNTTVSAAGATCIANDQSGSLGTLGASISGDKVVCSVAATVTWANAGSCTAANPVYSSGTAQISCRYDPLAGNTTVSAPGATCIANNQTGTLNTLGASNSGDKVVCSVAATPTWVTVGGATPTCSPANPAYASGTGQISCRYDPVVAHDTVSGPNATCIANDQSGSLGTLGASISGNKVVCSVAATVTWANAGSCMVANPVYSSATPQVSCRYDPLAGNTTVSGPNATCIANNQTSTLTTLGASNSGDKVVCSVAATPTWVTVGGTTPTCSPANPDYAIGTGQISCRYDPLAGNTTVSAAGATCTANDQSGSLGTLGASISGNKVVCSVAATTTWVTIGGATPTCSPANPVYSSGTGQISCRYDPVLANTTVSAAGATCTANDQSGSLNTLGASISGNKVACSVAATPTWVNSATCSPANQNYATGAAQVSCRYDTANTSVSAPGATCVGNDQSGLMGTIGASISGNQVICSLGTINWVDATGAPPTCTPAAANYATGTAAISCRYRPTADATKTLTDQSTCTAFSQPTSAPMSGNQVTCAYQGSTYSTTTETSCQWNTSATAATEKVECAYDTAANTASGAVGTCTTVAQSTGSSQGTIWSGPAKACAYRTATVATNQPNCTHTGSMSSGPNYSYYETCAYGSPVVSSASSCTQSTAEAGPDYIKGATVACTYLGTPTSSNAVGSCTWVAPSATWATPVTTCTYDAQVTSNVSSCSETAEGTSNTGTYSGPARVCAYSSTPTSTNLNAGSCTASRQTASPYTAATAVDCAFNATPTTSTVTSCTKKDEAGPAYTGAKIACGYSGSFSAWSDVTSGSCVAADQSAAAATTTTAPSGTAFAEWRACQYVARPDTYAGSCTDVPASTSPNYTVRNPVVCTQGAYVTSSVTAAATIVDACTVATNTTGDVNGTPPSTQVDVSTACTYAASPTVADAPSCVEHPRDAGAAKTTEVLCTYTTGPWVRATTTAACVEQGTQPPPASMVPADFVGGKNVQCRIIEPASAGTGTAASPVPDPSCTPGPVYIDGSNVQTNCVLTMNTTPTPVKASTCHGTVGLPSGPDYIKEICTTTNPSTTVMGCTGQVEAPPLWQTITCVDNAGTGTVNSLADVAAYYYYTDLRTAALGNCVGSAVAPATTGSTLCSSSEPMNNVPTTTKDPLSTQHMTTFTLGLGASGYMKYSETYLADSTGDYATVYGTGAHTAAEGIAADPLTGVCSWQATGNCNWPYPASDEQTTIDDLWHAGVNGHGAYFSATDPKSLSTSISAALSGVAAAGGASASPTISNPSLSPADNYVFSSTYTTSDWTGELIRRQLDPYTGAVAASVDWAVQAKLDAKSAASRTIYTFDSSVATTKLKPFTSANFAANSNFLTPHISTSPTGLTQFLCSAADTCLAAADQTLASGGNLVNFLRGERTNEGALDDNNKYYRQRPHVLGDMVNAQAVYVYKPLYTYADPGYSAFVTAQSSRQAVVYTAANDGMLHAFAAKGSAATEAAVEASAAASSASFLDPTNTSLATAASLAVATAATAVAADTGIGQEMWAYIPSMVIPDLYKLADKKYKDKHRYYVDATPVVGDVCISNCSNSATAVWRTIMVGGLGHGGRGYYALDITVPASPKALWEFTDTNLGYSYGNPQIAKMNDGTWVVLLTSGYNNIPNDDGPGGDGVGRLYVLNAATGAQIPGVSPISTGAGSVTDPSGLAFISAQVVNPVSDNTIEAVYGGDLYGNLWRFDINNTVGAVGYDAQLLAVLKDGSNNRQPITTKPEVGLIPKVGVKVVYVGTGRFLAASDATDTSQQSFYAIKDLRATGTTPATAIFDHPGDSPRAGIRSSGGFIRQVQTEIDCPAAAAALFFCDLGTKVRTSTAYPVDFSSDNGWFVDFVGVSERANTDPALALGLLSFNTNAPSLAACDVGGKSYQYDLDYLTGGPIQAPGNFIPATQTGYASKFLANELASGVRLVITKSGKLLSITGLSGGSINIGQPPLPPPASISRRTSWRELIRE